jgi:hypothetical protein
MDARREGEATPMKNRTTVERKCRYDGDLRGRVARGHEVDYLPNPLVSGPTLSCQLFNGDRLLGSGPCNGHFQSSAAALRLPGAPLIDFSTIAAGPSTGRIDFDVTGGSFAFDGRGTVSIGRLISKGNIEWC